MWQSCGNRVAIVWQPCGKRGPATTGSYGSAVSWLCHWRPSEAKGTLSCASLLSQTHAQAMECNVTHGNACSAFSSPLERCPIDLQQPRQQVELRYKGEWMDGVGYNTLSQTNKRNDHVTDRNVHLDFNVANDI